MFFFTAFRGFGKTTLSYYHCQRNGGRELKSPPGRSSNGRAIWAAILTGLQEGDVLFIDESIVESCRRRDPLSGHGGFSAGSDHRQGPGARSVKMDLPRFTLVGATTRTGLLTPPLRDRFGVVLRLGSITPEELVTIVQRSAAILGMPIDESGHWSLAGFPAAPRGSPTGCCAGFVILAQVGNHSRGRSRRGRCGATAWGSTVRLMENGRRIC